MSNEIIFVINESPEGGYEAKALDYPIFTESDSIEELRIMIKDAVHCHFDSTQSPPIIRLHFVREEVISA